MMRLASFGLAAAVTALACHPGTLLDAPVPAGVVDPSSLGTLQGAEALRAGAITLFAEALTGTNLMIEEGGVMSDEFHNDYPGVEVQAVDARRINPASALTDGTYARLQKARQAAETAVRHLRQFVNQGTGGDASEMWSLVGYTRLFLAEHMCSGIPLSEVADDGTVTLSPGLSTDSVLALALASFDSAIASAAGNQMPRSLAAIGRARTLLDQGRYADAATAVAGVPATFQYVVAAPSASYTTYSLYLEMAYPGGFLTVADRKGVNGLDYISAHDPRMPIDSLGATYGGPPQYYPLKFPLNTTTNDPVPIASGAEASLIRAEGLLPINGGSGSAWLDTLQALRIALGDTETIADPGTPDAQLDVLMRERAFTMFGTGHRLGDMRRLVRRYGRSASTVFPVGPFINGNQNYFTTYGNDVNFPILNAEIGNPRFHGCLNRSA